MGEADITEFLLRLIVIAAFTVMVVDGLLLLTEFKAAIKTSSLKRLGIDFGENVISSSCTADIKGLLNETKIDKENADYGAGKNGLSGFSCMKTAFKARTLIKAETSGGEEKWNFGFDEGKNYENMYEFPAAVNMSDGSIAPAVVDVVAEASVDCNSGNDGKNCYNCIEEKECESMGCSWSPAKPTTGPGFCLPKYSCIGAVCYKVG